MVCDVASHYGVAEAGETVVRASYPLYSRHVQAINVQQGPAVAEAAVKAPVAARYEGRRQVSVSTRREPSPTALDPSRDV